MKPYSRTVRTIAILLGAVLVLALLVTACAKRDPVPTSTEDEAARMEKMKATMQGMAGKSMKSGAGGMKSPGGQPPAEGGE